MLLTRRGFTLAEMLIVVVILGGLTLFSLPKFNTLLERNNLNSARQEIAAAIATARAAAVQKGSTAQVVLNNSTLTVSVGGMGGGANMTLVGPKPLRTLYNVSLTSNAPNDTTVSFDMRGFARLSSTRVVRIVGATRSDSLCLTSSGQIMPRNCAL